MFKQNGGTRVSVSITLLLLNVVLATHNTDTSTSSNISSNVAQVQHLPLPPVMTGAFDTAYFIEHLSWQPTSIRDVIGREIIDQLQPWLWVGGVNGRKYETVTTFASVGCCLVNGKDDSSKDDGPASRNAVCNLPPTKEQKEGGEGAHEVSLWAVLSDQSAFDGCVALVRITNTIGMAVTTPTFLKDFDLTAVNWEQSGLVYLPPKSAVAVLPSASASGSSFSSSATGQQKTARFVCIIEGSGNVSVSNPQFTPELGEAVPTQYEGTYGEGDCVYAPTGWVATLEAVTHTTALLFTWPDDVIITEAFLELLERKGEEEEEASSRLPPTSPGSQEALKREHNGNFLASFLPDDNEEDNSKKLWVKPPVLPHFLQHYYFSKRAPVRQHQFLDKMKTDSLLIPNLVDCPPHSECHYLLLALLRELDLNGDGELGPQDLSSLTPTTLPALLLHVDDLVQEIRDLALDQWYEAMEGSPAEWEEFADRASEKKKESARAVAKRIQDREMTPDELLTIMDKLPELYEELQDFDLLVEEEDDDAVNSRRQEL